MEKNGTVVCQKLLSKLVRIIFIQYPIEKVIKLSVSFKIVFL